MTVSRLIEVLRSCGTPEAEILTCPDGGEYLPILQVEVIHKEDPGQCQVVIH